MTISFVFIAILMTALVTVLLYLNFHDKLRQDMRRRLLNIVSIAVLQVDAGAHTVLVDPDDEGNAVYMRIKLVLQHIHDAEPDIRFVYTMRQDTKGQVIFVVDADPDPKTIAHLGDVYDDAGPTLMSNFATLDHPIVEKEFYTDKWGTWLTGYAPFYTTDGKREGVLGIDIAAAKVMAYERQFLWVVLFAFAATVPLTLLLGWFFGRRLAAPISALTVGVTRIETENLDYRVEVRTGDEIGELATAFNSMTYRLKQSRDELREYQEHLEELVEERTAELVKANKQLTDAISRVKTLSGMLPICASCKKIRDDKGYWSQIESYVRDHSEVEFSHSLCPECVEKLYPERHKTDKGGQENDL